MLLVYCCDYCGHKGSIYVSWDQAYSERCDRCNSYVSMEEKKKYDVFGYETGEQKDVKKQDIFGYDYKKKR